MAVNLIVLAVTVLMGGFLVLWLAFPRVRPWIETPKYRVLEWDRVPPETSRPADTNRHTRPADHGIDV